MYSQLRNSRGNNLLDDITTYVANMACYDGIIVMYYLPAVVIDTTVLVSPCLPSLVRPCTVMS